MGSGAGGGNGQRSGAVFYRFNDASGTVHIVDSLDRVPLAERAHAERVQYDDWTPVNGARGAQPASAHHLGAEGFSNWQMFGLGAGAVLLTVLLFRVLPGARGMVLRLVVVLAVVAGLSAAYLGWMRRATQQSNELLASPSAVIDDAKSAVEKLNARMREQQAQLKEAEQTK